MIVTGAFLAEQVMAADGKMFVNGGVVTSWTRPPGQDFWLNLVILTQAAPDKVAATSVTIIGPDDEGQDFPLSAHGGAESGFDAGWFSTPVGIGGNRPDGRYRIVVGEKISLPLEVRSAE